MDAHTQDGKTPLKVMHQCKHCGHLSSREEAPEVALISGVFECPKCGEAGSLHVIVIEAEASTDEES